MASVLVDPGETRARRFTCPTCGWMFLKFTSAWRANNLAAEHRLYEESYLYRT